MAVIENAPLKMAKNTFHRNEKGAKDEVKWVSYQNSIKHQHMFDLKTFRNIAKENLCKHRLWLLQRNPTS